MVISRRDVLQGAAAGGFMTLQASKSLSAATPRAKAVLFDAFAIFDPRTVSLAAQNAIGEQSAEFSRIWRAKQFEYTWLRNSGGVYKNFWDVTADALAFADRQMRLQLAPDVRQSLLQSYLNLKPWADVPAGLESLKAKGLKLGILSNFTAAMQRAAIANTSGLTFDVLLSTDAVQCFKPDPKAYDMGTGALGLTKDEIAYVAFAGWDAVGAAWFGYPTFWLNRLNAVEEHLDAGQIAAGSHFDELVTFLLA